jgi:hypothetical protein
MSLPKQESLNSSSVQNVHNLNNDRVKNTSFGKEPSVSLNKEGSLFKEVESKTGAIKNNIQSKGIDLQKNYDSKKDRSTVTRAGETSANNVRSVVKNSWESIKGNNNKSGKASNLSENINSVLSNLEDKKLPPSIKKGEKHN